MSNTASFYVITPKANAPRVYDVVAADTDIREVGIVADPFSFSEDSEECVVIDIQTADHVDITIVEADLIAKARNAGFTAVTEDEYFAESDAFYAAEAAQRPAEVPRR